MATAMAAKAKSAPPEHEPTQFQVDAAETRAVVAITKLLRVICKR